MLQDMEARHEAATDITFHRAVAKLSREIIRSEFIPEYQMTYPKISALIEKLENIPQLNTCIKYENLASYVQDYPFAEGATVNDILHRLFDMGMIGVRKRREIPTTGVCGTVVQEGINVSYCFFYNSKLMSPFVGNDEIVFHPMFYDRLDLLHDANFVIHELRWETLD